MDYDYSKRSYLLPEGCKDLIDALTLKSQQKPKTQLPLQSVLLPPIIGELIVQEPTTVGQLAALLKAKPFQIIADLMQWGVFATIKQEIEFAIVLRVARKYGFIAKRAT